ncbi:hypothetical protein D3C72_2340230 [compost metagenome]
MPAGSVRAASSLRLTSAVVASAIGTVNANLSARSLVMVTDVTTKSKRLVARPGKMPWNGTSNCLTFTPGASARIRFIRSGP